MVDRDDDIKVGAKSTAVLFGDLDLVIQGILYALFFIALMLVGQRAAMGNWYWAGLAVAAVLVAWQFRISRKRERGPLFRAFLHNHWVGLAVFAGIALDFALRG
jgi:4-hydroxybenzoate polyprenyltransferase